MKGRFAQLVLTAVLCLFLSGCHLDKQQQKLATNSTHQADLHPTDTLIASQIGSQHSAAATLLSTLQKDASSSATTKTPAPVIQPQPAPGQPPLPITSYLSLSASPEGDFSTDRFDDLPADTLAEFTSDVPSLFVEVDDFGHVQALNLEMGLTALNLPEGGVVEWPLSFQAYCNCTQAYGLHQTDDAEARLDFRTGKFDLSAAFAEAGKGLRSVNMNSDLNKTSISKGESQSAKTELLLFGPSDRVTLTGQLELFFSGPAARQIGGQFTTRPENNLSDILFAMQFASQHPD